MAIETLIATTLQDNMPRNLIYTNCKGQWRENLILKWRFITLKDQVGNKMFSIIDKMCIMSFLYINVTPPIGRLPTWSHIINIFIYFQHIITRSIEKAQYKKTWINCTIIDQQLLLVEMNAHPSPFASSTRINMGKVQIQSNKIESYS